MGIHLIRETKAMVDHLYSNFLHDEKVYARVEQHWIELWEKIDPAIRAGWQQPWFQPLPPSISEGNPIFSAVSRSLKRGIRILQSEPVEKRLEFVAYLDTFGGSIFDPNAIHELVISCALSEAAATIAVSLMIPWVEGKAVSFDLYDAGLIASNGSGVERIYSECFLPEADLIITNDSAYEALAVPYLAPAA
jgi:hypothetical protein